MNPDFRDILSEFSVGEVRFLLVGAYAMATLGLVRSTGDIDLWVRRDEVNARRILTVTRSLGRPVLVRLDPTWRQFQIGVAPNRIDILTSIDGVEFDEAWPGHVDAEVEGVKVPVIGLEHLLRNKRATGRPKDRIDADWLEANRGIGEEGR